MLDAEFRTKKHNLWLRWVQNEGKENWPANKLLKWRTVRVQRVQKKPRGVWGQQGYGQKGFQMNGVAVWSPGSNMVPISLTFCIHILCSSSDIVSEFIFVIYRIWRKYWCVTSEASSWKTLPFLLGFLGSVSLEEVISHSLRICKQ